MTSLELAQDAAIRLNYDERKAFAMWFRAWCVDVLGDDIRNTGRLNEIRARIVRLPPGFLTRGAKCERPGFHGPLRIQPQEECHNTVMDCNGKVICDSLNSDLRVIEEYDREIGAWRDVGTRDYFEFFANAKQDIEWLVGEVEGR
jgi:hypothetical protein